MSSRLARFLLLGVALSALLLGSQAYAAAYRSPAASANILTATTLSSIYDWFYTSDSEGSQLGYAVHTAGDVDGDGHLDILVGAPKHPLNSVVQGAAFLFFGGAYNGDAYGLPPAGKSLGVGSEHDLKGARFGHAVGTAGDVNDDGYDDIIVGATDFQVAFAGVAGTPQSGAVFVYHGSPDRSESGLGTAPTWFMQAEARDIALGWAVSTAGDVNHDGFDDVIVSAPLYGSSSDQDGEGKVYLYLGDSDGLSAVPAWTYECNQPNAMCGDSLDATGDINGDGFDDVIVGASGWDGAFSNQGLALVFYGFGGGLQSEPAWTLEGGQGGARFGRSVAGAGDVNHDGYPDILVGAPNFTCDGDLSQAGAAFLFLGSPTGPSLAPDWASCGEEAAAAYGHALHTAGDVNMDGYADIIIGSPFLGTNGDIAHQLDEGGAYIFYGGDAGPNALPDWVAYGDKTEAYFGYSVASAGDVNLDGADDVLIGAYNYRIDTIKKGRTYAYYSSSNGPQYTLFLPFVTQP